MRNVNALNPPAFLNLSTKAMKGEVWKDVPGYESLYKVSNLGRVKALQKITRESNKSGCRNKYNELPLIFAKVLKEKKLQEALLRP